jgi:hypothetical protein
MLRVERTPEATHPRDEQLRRQAFLGMQRFDLGSLFETAGDEDGDGEETRPIGGADDFYRLVPTLVRACHDYRRVNDFAAVFALLRWARGQGATFYDPPPRPREVPTPGSLIVADDRLEPVAELGPGGDHRHIVESLLRRLEKLATEAGPTLVELQRRVREPLVSSLDLRTSVWSALDEIDHGDGALAERLSQAAPELRQRHETLEHDLEEAVRAFMEAPSGSDEEADALERTREAEAALATLTAEIAPDLGDVDRRVEAAAGQLARAIELERGIPSDGRISELLVEAAPAEARPGLAALGDDLAVHDRELAELRRRSKTLEERVSQVMDELGALDPEAALAAAAPQTLSRYRELEEQGAEQMQICWAAPFDSQEEAVALRRAEELAAEAKALIHEALPHAAELESRLAETTAELESLAAEIEAAESQREETLRRQREAIASAHGTPAATWWRLLDELKARLEAEQLALEWRTALLSG